MKGNTLMLLEGTFGIRQVKNKREKVVCTWYCVMYIVWFYLEGLLVASLPVGLRVDAFRLSNHVNAFTTTSSTDYIEVDTSNRLTVLFVCFLLIVIS